MKKSRLSTFDAGGGSMGAKVRAFDWAATPLGPISGWSGALRITVDQMLASKFPACLFWGEDLIAIYNDGYEVILGAKPEALGQPMRVTWAEAWPGLQPIAEKALAGESTFIEDFPLAIDRSGSLEEAYFTFNYGPIFDEHGVVVGMLDTVVETTDKVLYARRSQEERERQQRLLQQMPGFVGVLSGPTHRFEYVNDAYVQIAGPRQFIGRTIREVFPELESQGFFEMLDQVYASGQPFKAKAIPLKLDGEGGDRFIDLLYEPVLDAAGRVQGIFVGGYDVTDRMRAEAEVRAREASLRTLNAELEQRVIERTLARGRTWQVSPDMLCVIDASGRFEATNPAWEKTLGWTEAEMTSATFSYFVHPDDLAPSVAAWSDASRRHLPVMHFENRYRTRTGDWRWLRWDAVPEDDRVYCIARDVTAEKADVRALAETQEALRQAQKMEAVGQLTGGLAHDFNNLLSTISNSLQILRIKLATGKIEGAERYIGMGEDSVRRAAALTHRLLAFSRRQTLDPQAVDVNQLTGGMEEMLRRTMGPGIEVQAIDAQGLWATRIDASQLESALLNLCLNARDAMPDGGRLTIATANESFDERAAAELELPPGDYVSLSVSDTGTGMPPDVVERIFDPFYTTKPIGVGTGLGLSMVYGFVRQSEGQVRVRSEVGHGTTMTLYLPRHHGEVAGLQSTPVPAALAEGNGETVVIVEDEMGIRVTLEEVLLESGYRVMTAENGPDGMAILGSDVPVDLLITDVGLPGGMNGRQVADAARLRRPDLKVLFITGYADNAAVGNGLLAPGMAVLTKPFQIATLMTRVKTMVGQP